MTSSRVEWVEGAPVGRYALVRPLARGGMAQVWLARQHGPGGFVREVCLKRVLAEGPELTAEVCRLFLAEAQLAAQLKHPNVVQVLDFDEAGDTPYLVMEYLEGETLAALWARSAAADTPLSPRLAAGIMERCARGLGYAHQKAKDSRGEPLRVVHRDFAPHNVFLTSDGLVKVLDFGIARAVGAPLRTAAGLVRGRAAYMAPEQAAGDAVPASDVFSMGIVSFELLTGRRFWPAQDPLPIFQQLLGDGPLPSPGEVNPFVPPALDALVRRMLARSVGDRFPDGVACAEALSGWAREARMELSEDELAAELRLRAPSGPFVRPSAPHAVTLVKGAPAPVPRPQAPCPDAAPGPTVLLFPVGAAGADVPAATARTEVVPSVSVTPHAAVLASPVPAVPRPSRPPAPRPSAKPAPPVAGGSATVVSAHPVPAAVASSTPGDGVSRRAAVASSAPASPASGAPSSASPSSASLSSASSSPASSSSASSSSASSAARRPRRAAESDVALAAVTRSRAPLIALGVLATVLLVGAGVLLSGGRSASVAAELAPSPPLPPPLVAAPAPAVDAPAPRVSLRISSVAPGAVVLRDDVIIGQAPLVIEGLEGEIVELALEAPGFTRLTQKIRLSKNFERLELAPERVKAVKPKPASPPPPPDLLNPYE